MARTVAVLLALFTALDGPGASRFVHASGRVQSADSVDASGALRGGQAPERGACQAGVFADGTVLRNDQVGVSFLVQNGQRRRSPDVETDGYLVNARGESLAVDGCQLQLMSEGPPLPSIRSAPLLLRGAGSPGGRPVGEWAGVERAGDRIYVAARAYPSDPADPAVHHVKFTFRRVAAASWDVGCWAHALVSRSEGLYECTIDADRMGDGDVKLSFDIVQMDGSEANAAAENLLFNPATGNKVQVLP